MSICVFGIFVADLCFFANDIPIPGQTILGKKYIIGPGGKGSNLTKQLQHQELEVMYLL